MATVPSIGRADAAPSAAAGRLYEEYYDRVYGYCLYRLGSREEAEDAAQTTFLYAFRGLTRGVVPQVEASWVFTIAKNVCLARIRTRGRRKEHELPQDPQALQEIWAAPERDGSRAGELEEALLRLPEQQRRAILLREWRGFSYREIAAELGLSVAAVETLIFRARRSLVEILGDEPPSRSRRRAVLGLDLGSLGAMLKPAFTAGTAAKLAAAAATVVTATLVAGGAVRGERPQTNFPGATTPSSAPVSVRVEASEHAALVTAAVAAPVQTAAPKKASPGGDPERSAPATEPVRQSSTAAPLEPVADAVEDVTGSAGLEVELPPTPELPAAPELPDLGPGLPATPNLPEAELPLP